MSYTLRAKTTALGLIDLPDYQSLSFGQEFSDVGGIDITYAKNGVNAEHLKDEAIVIVFWDGEELRDSRYIIQSGDSERDPTEPYFTIKGKSVLDVFRRVVLRHPINPGQNVTFANSSPGFILKTLFDVAKDRGRLVGITYNFTTAADSDGVPWPKTHTTEYKPGVHYLSILHDLVDKGFIEVSMTGDQLNAYVAGTMGTDKTTGNNPLELRYGLDYTETPNKWSSEARSGYSLIIGDEGTYAEFEDNTIAAGPYGRPEQSVSQGGVKDSGALELINLYNLQNASRTTEEFTRRVNLSETSYIPGIDYRVGDYIYDRVGDTPQRYRVISIAVGVDDGAPVDAAIVLNDKFMEREVRNQRRIDGIVGGGSSDGTGGGLPSDAPDYTIPKPPSGVAITSGSYVDPVDGLTRVVASTSWAQPTHNTDNSLITDLDGYQAEHRFSKEANYSAITKWHPARPDPTLQARWDRRGKNTSDNWMGADGGSSARAANGEDWFFWSDTAWGTLSKTGVSNMNSMPRNTITISDPTSGSDLRGHAGRRNLVPDGIALLTDAANMWSIANGTRVIEDGEGGSDGRWLRVTAGANSVSSYAYRLLPHGSLVAGKEYFATAKINPGNAATPRFYVTQYNAAGAQISGTQKVIAADSDGWARVMFTAHDLASTCYVMLSLGNSPEGTSAAISMIGVFQTDHALQSWQPQIHSEDVYNEVTNPDGASGVASTAAEALLYTNYSTNPSGENGFSSWSIYSSTTREQIVGQNPWVGNSFIRFTTVGTTGNKFMHYRIPVGTETQVGARFRIRSSVPDLRMSASLYQYSSTGGRITGGDTSTTFDLTTSWQEVVVPARTMSGADSIGLMFLASNGGVGNWADGVQVDVDGVEIIGGSAFPPFYFDGDTSTPNGFRSQWTGEPGSSSSTLYLTSDVARNYVENPVLHRDLTHWEYYGSGNTISRSKAELPGLAGASGPLPEVVGYSALSTWFTDLAKAGTQSVGVGVIGDSCTESTGDTSNTDLSDRYIEQVQALLRKDTAVSGVPINPPGYYGASTYIPVGYIHDGPADWTFETADPVKYPLSPLQSGFGVGGRLRNISAGHKAHFTGTFDQFRLHFAKSGWGRYLRILVDGVEQVRLNTYGAEESSFWTSPPLGLGEHTVVCEYVPTDGLSGGSVTLLGADLWNADRNKGVRVYDLSGSGKAAQDVASGTREMDDNFRSRSMSLLVIMLGFNDAGRTADWGGPRTSAQFKSDITKIISGARSRGFTGSVLLVGEWQASQLTTTEPQANYRDRLREIAVSDSKVAYIDLSTVMPDTTTETWGQENHYVDGLHPSMKGMTRIAECIYHSITPSGDGKASVQVMTSGNTAFGGAQVRTAAHSTPWPVGSVYAAGAWVKAPAGVTMMLRLLAEGDTGVGNNFVGTGDWQWVTAPPQMVTSSATSAPYLIIRHRDATKMNFWVSHAIISNVPVTEYWDGDTQNAGVRYSWAGTRWRSQSVAKTQVPTGGWASHSSAVIRYDSTERVQGEGSVLMTVTSPVAAPGPIVNVPVEANKYVTAIFTVKTDYAATKYTVYLRNGTTIVAQGVTTPNQHNPWTEVRFNFRPETAITSVWVRATHPSGNAPVGSRVWVSEATVVANDRRYYRGGPFHGGQSGQGVATEWTGTPHNSRTKGMFYNSSSTPSFGQAGALLHPAAAGGDLSEYLWVTSAAKVPGVDRAIVICNGMRNRALRQGGPWNFQRNGTMYIVEYDMANKRILRFQQWFDDITIQWGETCYFDGSYFYVYGSGGNDFKGTAHVMRVPASDPVNGPRQFWNGSTWTGSGTPAVIAEFNSQGAWTGVRTFRDKWIAVFCSGHMDQMDGWEAPAPEGPWTRIGPIHKFSENHTVSLKYVPRFHPQLDSNEKGIAISYSAAGQNGNTKYGAEFLRGPAGDLELAMADAPWFDRVNVENSPYIRGGLSSGYLYASRVRAYDRSGNTSEWAYAAPIYLAGDQDAPPQPSKPRVTSFFRGIKIEINGLTAMGGSQPRDFLRFAVHTSYEEGFEPDETNLIDSIYTATGGTSIESDLMWGFERYVKIVAWDKSDNHSIPSEVASASPERLSDPDLPEKLIDGAKHIKDESISVKHLSVGALDNSVVPNGNMEDWDGQSQFPSGWKAGWPRGNYNDWDTAASFGVETSNPITGSKSIRITTTSKSSRQFLSKAFPLTPGDVYYVKAVVRASRKLSGNYIALNLLAGTTEDMVNGFADPRAATLSVGSAGPDTSTYVIEGQVEVPDYFSDGTGYAMRFGAVGIDCGHDGAASYTAWVDDVEVRQVVGEAAIANASINRAKIRYLAVDDARISSVSVGKLVAGELWADITVSARVMTAKTGQRVEMNKDGFFGFNGSDSTPVTEVRASDGGLVSRWIRTNTTGTRIEMGTYGKAMGADSALMSFHPSIAKWQFPPAFGFGGDYRQGSIPGIAMHAGSYTEQRYNQYGMNMIAVDQVGGITMTTGNLLNGKESTYGASISATAGGASGVIDLRSGTLYGTGADDRARILLSPAWPGRSSPVDLTRFDLNYGTINFLPAGTTSNVSLRHAFEDEWSGMKFYHVLLSTASGGFRMATSEFSDAFRINPWGIIGGPEWDQAAKIGVAGSGPTARYAIIWYRDGDNAPSIRVHNGPHGQMVASKTFVIDHPKDEDKYLVHAAIEGPTADVFYRGESRLQDGRAWVDLPGYFEELTIEGTATVQITPITSAGGSVPSVLAVSRVEDGRFLVVAAPGGDQNISFFWEVKAERARTQFDVEPSRKDVRLRGDGPYTYLEPR